MANPIFPDSESALIYVTLKGVAQDWVGRLPVDTKPEDCCDMDVSWDGIYDTNNDPNGPHDGLCFAARPSQANGGDESYARSIWRALCIRT